MGVLMFTLTVVLAGIPGLVDTWDVKNEGEWTFRGFGLAVAVAFGLTGALMALKRPENRIGWLFSATGSGFAVVTACEIYAVLPLIQGERGSFLYPMAWFASWGWVAYLGLTAYAILLFPTGHLPSSGWRLPARLMIGAWVVAAVGFAFAPGPLNNIPLTNRYAFPPGPVTNALVAIGGSSLMVALAASVVGVVQRYRASQGLERQQMKLFALAAAGQPTSIALVLSAEVLAPGLVDVFASLQGLATVAIPVAMSIAILRYRLYDIDVIINRALVYGLLSGVLVTVYLGAVVLFQRVLAPITADSDVAIAGSTLAVAGLFRPLRAKVQEFIDRRFYRHKYDAADTLSHFAARLRDEVDLAAVRNELLRVTGATVQPAHASLWLRPSSPKGTP